MTALRIGVPGPPHVPDGAGTPIAVGGPRLVAVRSAAGLGTGSFARGTAPQPTAAAALLDSR